MRLGFTPALFVLATGALCSAPATATAQDCGSWPQPVLCEAQLLVTTDGAKAERLKGDSRLRLAPRGQVDLDIEGRDQRGRRFPDEYLALGYRAEGCGRLLQVEDRNRGLRVRARGEAGRCRLELWVPGNLNFAWTLDVDVDPAARTSYSRRDAETVVRALYRAVLQRDVDQDSLRAAVAETQQGNLESLVGAMVRSGEFLQRRGRLSHEDMLDAFYQGVFGRPADSLGVKDYLNLVRQGRHAEVLLRLIRSAEFEKRLRG
ncbi:MAG: DUF4214 domain-containing protein [Vicinamibacterales bacterium]